MKGRAFLLSCLLILGVLAVSTGMALAAQQPGRMNGQMGGQMNGRQGGRMRGMNVDRMVARMKSDLKLSDTQTSQVRDLFEKQQKEMQDWRGSHANATREDMRAHRQDMMKEMNDGLKKILTPAQYKKQQEMMRQRMRRGMMRGPQGPPQN
jgi:Spy/CpxP family protein refolding chaperone